MKHIIEKHREAITISNGEVKHNFDGIPASDFPALISDLEAEWCKAMEWVGKEHIYLTIAGHWLNVRTHENFTIHELLKIYQEQCNLEGKPL